MSAMHDTVVAEIRNVHARTVDIACDITGALLHSILFGRLLNASAPRVESLLIGTEELSFATLDDEIVRRRVDKSVERLARELGGGVVGVAQIELVFGTISAQVHRERRHLEQKSSAPQGAVASTRVMRKVSRWASWLTDALATKEPSPATQCAMSRDSVRADDCARLENQCIQSGGSLVWERWRLNVYVVPSLDDDACAKRTAALFEELQIALSQRAHMVPSPSSVCHGSFPFQCVVFEGARSEQRGAKLHRSATQEIPRARSAARPIGGHSRARSSTKTVRSDDSRHDENQNQSGSGAWWKTMKLSPGSGTWENSLDLLRDVVGSAPTLSSSPPF